MSFIFYMTRIGLSDYWRSIARVSCLFIVFGTGFLMGPLNVLMGSSLSHDSWAIAGKTFQYAGAMAGLLGCGAASTAILEDRDAHRFELRIITECRSIDYLLSKLLVLLIPFAVVGVFLSALSFIYCCVTFGLMDPAAFFAALIVIYSPVVIFGVLFGLVLSTLTKSRFFTMVCYMGLLVASFLWLPEPSSVFDITGEALYTAYFDVPVESLNASDYPQMSQSVWDMALGLSAERKLYGSYNILFLVGSSAAMMVALVVLLHHKWTVNARSLLPSSVSNTFLSTGSSRIFASLKAGKAWRLAIVINLVMLTGIFQIYNDNPFPAGVFSIECCTSLCFVFIFSSIYSSDSKAGIGELLFTRPTIRRHFIFRIVGTSAALLLVLVIQAFQWQGAMSTSPTILILAGFTSAIFFSSLAFLLGMLTRNESTVNTLVTGIWLFLQLPDVKTAISGSILHWVYPFRLSMNGSVDITLLPVLAVSVVLFSVGAVLVGRPGFILEK